MNKCLHAVLCAVVMAFVSSCNTQSSQSISAAITHVDVHPQGDVVSELSSSIWYVFQASNGDYWFGSDGDGVFRFDGKAITQFTVKHGLADGQVRGIQEDKAGNIFVNTVKGVCKFDGKEFVTLTPVAEVSPLSEWKLQADDLWFAGPQDSGVVLRYDGKDLYRLKFPATKRGDEELRRFPRTQFPNAKYSPYDVYLIYQDSKGFLWFGTATLGACRFDGKSFDWFYEEHLTNTPNGGSFGIRSIAEDQDGAFWVCNTQYRFHIDQGDQARGSGEVAYTRSVGIEDLTKRVGEKYMYFLSVVKGNDGNLWMATFRDGVWRYDGKDMKQYLIGDGSTSESTFLMYKDRRGDLWVGTHKAGAHRFNGSKFEKFSAAGAK